MAKLAIVARCMTVETVQVCPRARRGRHYCELAIAVNEGAVTVTSQFGLR